MHKCNAYPALRGGGDRRHVVNDNSDEGFSVGRARRPRMKTGRDARFKPRVLCNAGTLFQAIYRETPRAVTPTEVGIIVNWILVT